jgi:AcrR family transcriptional regulator
MLFFLPSAFCFLPSPDREFLSNDRAFSELNEREAMTSQTRSKEEVVQEYRIQSIQEAAMRVIARKGMAAATMKEIADEAGIAKGTIYLYFHDRDDLVEKTFERAISQLHDSLALAIGAETTFEGRLRSIIRTKLGYFDQNREFFRLYSSLRFPEGSAQQQRRHRRNCGPQYQEHVDRLTRILTDAMDHGEIGRADPARLAVFLIEGINAIVIQRVTEEAPPPQEDDVEMITSTVMHGLAL